MSTENNENPAKIVRKQYSPLKSKPLKLNTRVLYAGKLQRIKQWSGNYHLHDFAEILFVSQGKGEITINGDVMPVEKGDIIVYPPNVKHSEHTRPDSNDSLELLFFGVTGLKLNNLSPDYLLPENACPVIKTSGGNDDEGRLRWLFEAIYSEVESTKPYSEMMLDFYVKLVLTEILRKTEIEERSLIKNTTFSEIYHYISSHYTEINTIEDICDNLYVNKYYVSHIFKKYTGVAPMNYVRKLRMTLAKQLLAETDLSASKISRRCGYADTTCFFRNFKSVEKVTPLEYRILAKNNTSPPPDRVLTTTVGTIYPKKR